MVDKALRYCVYVYPGKPPYPWGAFGLYASEDQMKNPAFDIPLSCCIVLIFPTAVVMPFGLKNPGEYPDINNPSLFS